MKYEQNAVRRSNRQIQHLGYSAGFFTGFGNTLVSPTTTQDRTEMEYEGVVWSYGVAGIVGINSLALGVSVGVDHLLDNNKSIWLYENRPWVALVLGLNLN
ncbi:MAG: hypothetical protein Q4F57_08660 [Weeksellaceae bacterium]|nr:hypothetical protein [Weeksellaceae bacterium]